MIVVVNPLTFFTFNNVRWDLEELVFDSPTPRSLDTKSFGKSKKTPYHFDLVIIRSSRSVELESLVTTTKEL